uniref:Uncharacterized protein n=1 Tax=Schistocephalus solidus TaxID=70667 RepID=A0A0X3NM24_SCHSO
MEFQSISSSRLTICLLFINNYKSPNGTYGLKFQDKRVRLCNFPASFMLAICIAGQKPFLKRYTRRTDAFVQWIYFLLYKVQLPLLIIGIKARANHRHSQGTAETAAF